MPNLLRAGDIKVQDGVWASIAFGSLIALAWLLPNHYLPWASFHSELCAAFAGVVVVVAVLKTNKWDTLPRPAALLLSLPTIPLIQWGSGEIVYGGDVLVASVYLWWAGLSFWSGYAATEVVRKRLLTALVYALVFAAIVSTGIALYQWLGLRGLTIWVVEGQPAARAIGNIAQPNHLGTLLICGLAAIAFLRYSGAIGVPSMIVACSFVSLGLALTQSRSPWLAGCLISAWWIIWQRSHAKPVCEHLIIVCALVAWYFSAFWLAQVLPVQWLLDTAATGRSIGVGTRSTLWIQFLSSIVQSPWVGYGWQQGLGAQATGAMLHAGAEYSAYAHNVFLDLIIWNGLPIGLALSGAAMYWYVTTGLSLQGRPNQFRFMILTTVFAHALVEYPHAYLYFLIPTALIAGQLQAETSVLCKTTTALRWVLIVPIALCFGSSFALVHDYLPFENDRRVVQMWLARVGQMHEMSPAPSTWVLDYMEASARVSRGRVTEGMSADELDDLLRIARRMPNDFFLRRSIVALALNGRHREATIQLRQLRALHGEQRYASAVGWMRELVNGPSPSLRPFVDTIAEP